MTSGPFFSGIVQEDFAFRGYRTKAPLFYRDVRMMGGVFTADLARARALLPTPRHHALWVAPGRAVVAVHCMQYVDCDIGPYDEVALTIAVEHGDAPRVPPASLLRAALRSEFHGYVVDLPVTTEPALYGGIDVFGFPKYLAHVSFEDRADGRVCTLRDRETGEVILEVEGERIAARTVPQDRGRDALRTATLVSYPRQDGTTLRARMTVNLLECGTSVGRRRMTVRPGAHPRAAVWRELDLGAQLLYFWAPRCEAILFRPETCAGAR